MSLKLIVFQHNSFIQTSKISNIAIWFDENREVELFSEGNNSKVPTAHTELCDNSGLALI
jgi:hypothetical protein